MIINSEILYSILINKTVEASKLNKVEVLNHIYTVNNILLKKYNFIERIAKYQHYQKQNKQIKTQLIKIINQLNTSQIIQTMFINIIQNAQQNLATRVYNILLKKWNMYEVKIIAPSESIKKPNLSKFKNIAKVTYEYDPQIINGNITFINSLKIDNSVLGKINAIRDKLTT